MQSRRPGRSDSFLRKCGALAGTFTVESAAARPTSPRKINSIDLALRDREHLLEIMTARRRTAARWHQHVDRAAAAIGPRAGREDRTGRPRPRGGISRIGQHELVVEVIGRGCLPFGGTLAPPRPESVLSGVRCQISQNPADRRLPSRPPGRLRHGAQPVAGNAPGVKVDRWHPDRY